MAALATSLAASSPIYLPSLKVSARAASKQSKRTRFHRTFGTARSALVSGSPGQSRDDSKASSSSHHEAAVLPPNSLPGGMERRVVEAERAFNKFVTDLVIKVMDKFYDDDHAFARFYVLETIARVPYFGFVAVLHCYESFGWWRKGEYLKVHFEENLNEVHHLMIMEALGGDERWIDRFVAQHISVAYFVFSVILYALNPRMAYHFSECVELHAFHTYDKFLQQHGEKLKKLPAPKVALEYYTGSNSHKFTDFQTSLGFEPRHPKIENLYDVFLNIRDDEAEHCKTMRKCQTPSSSLAASLAAAQEVPPPDCSGIIECAINSSSYSDRSKKHQA